MAANRKTVRPHYPAVTPDFASTTWTFHNLPDVALLPTLDGTIVDWTHLQLTPYGVPTWATHVLIEARAYHTGGTSEAFFKVRGSATAHHGITALWCPPDTSSHQQTMVDVIVDVGAGIWYSIQVADFNSAVQWHLIGYYGAHPLPLGHQTHLQGLTMDGNGLVTPGPPKAMRPGDMWS